MTETQKDESLIELVKLVNNINTKLNENIEFTKAIDNKLNENIDFTKRIYNSVLIIEEVHGGKISALFDGYKTNHEMLVKIQNAIQKINTTLEKHDNQIFLIKSK